MRTSETIPEPVNDVHQDSWHSGGSTTLGLGIASLAATIIPLGLLLAPFIGAAAVGLGAWEMSHGRASERNVLGGIFGAIGMIVSGILLFVLRNILWRVLSQLQ